MKVILLIFLFTSFSSIAKDKEMPLTNQFVDFNNIKKILKKDGLQKVVTKKKKEVAAKNNKKTASKKKLYELPDDSDFWKIMVNNWLIKNNSVLKWDFHKPDYGLKDYFEIFLREVSELGVKFNILFVNTSNVTHFAFPYGENEYFFMISVPFIKIMDLSKLQISILLYEDLLRVKNGFVQSMLKSSTVNSLRNGNFYQKEFPKKAIKDLMEQFDNVIYEKGFDFQQQYKVTKQMKNIFNNNKKYWSNYYQLLKKIDELSKSNLMYKNYAKIYPSPELQLNWINPTKN